MKSLESVLHQLRSAGLIVENLETDTSNVVRIKVEGDKGKKASGWYRIFTVTSKKGNTYYVGAYGNWKNTALPERGVNIEYDGKGLTPEDHEAIKTKQQQARQASEAERKKRHREAAQRACATWAGLNEEGGSPYLSRKKVAALGVRFARGTVVLPVANIKGELLGLQFIQADGSKKFLTGTAKSGAFHLIGEVKEGTPLVLAEGYATGASVHMATRWPVAIAFDAGNVPKVARILRGQHQNVRLIIAADNDEAGLKYAKEASKASRGITVIPEFSNSSLGQTDFNDLHVLEGLERVAEILKVALSPSPPVVSNVESLVDSDSRFISTDSGVYYCDPEADQRFWVCSRLDVIAKTRNADNKDWGLLVRLTDDDGEEKEWNIQRRLFASDGGNQIVAELLGLGLDIDAGRNSNRRVLEYLKRHKTPNRVRLVPKLGWFGKAYLLPGSVIGDPDEPIHYYSGKKLLNRSSQGGTLGGWRENVAAYCQNNPVLMFSICIAFTGPLLELIGMETFGVHLVGDSSLGKSSVSRIAASVIGGPDYLRTWHTTSTALEPTAAEHSDSLLVLDEINQSDPHTVGQTVYMLGNGEGRARATDTGSGTRVQHHWRLVFLSNGERTLGEHLASIGKKAQTGMDMRLLNIPACVHKDEKTRKQKGVFVDLHNFAHGAELSEYLKQQVSLNYGHPYITFIEALASLSEQSKTKLIDYIHSQQSELERKYLTPEASGQARRAASKFSLIGVCGELATKQGITGWKKGEAIDAAESMFSAWLNQRGGEGSAEDKGILEHICLELQTKAESFFSRWDYEEKEAKIDTHQPKTSVRWGFRRVEVDSEYTGQAHSEESFYIYPAVFRNALCKGLNYRRVAELLKERGALQCHKGRGYTYYTHLPGSGKKKESVYLIRMSALKEVLPEEGEKSLGVEAA